jgi:hypothetical protein
LRINLLRKVFGVDKSRAKRLRRLCILFIEQLGPIGEIARLSDAICSAKNRSQRNKPNFHDDGKVSQLHIQRNNRRHQLTRFIHRQAGGPVIGLEESS